MFKKQELIDMENNVKQQINDDIAGFQQTLDSITDAITQANKNIDSLNQQQIDTEALIVLYQNTLSQIDEVITIIENS